MSDLQLTVKAPFIDAATEAYLQTILPGYESKEECDGVIELRRPGFRRVTVTAEAVLNAVLLDEVTGRIMPGHEAVAKAKADTAKKIARVVDREIHKMGHYYRNYVVPSPLKTRTSIEEMCTQAL